MNYCKAGDRAITVGIRRPGWNGRVVTVTSDPWEVVKDVLYESFGVIEGKPSSLRSSKTVIVNNISFENSRWAIESHCLIRIPPDSEMEEMFKEKENEMGYM